MKEIGHPSSLNNQESVDRPNHRSGKVGSLIRPSQVLFYPDKSKICVLVFLETTWNLLNKLKVPPLYDGSTKHFGLEASTWTELKVAKIIAIFHTFFWVALGYKALILKHWLLIKHKLFALKWNVSNINYAKANWISYAYNK